VSRGAIQLLFVLIGLAWMAFVSWDLFIHAFGDCGGDQMCENYKRAAGGLVFWRGLCVGLLIVGAYRLFRKEPNV
jgi:hypothetical protein